MSDALPLLRGFAPGDPLLLPVPGRAFVPVSAARFCGAAAALARSLPRARFAINRCEDPARFLLGSAAALLAGQTLVLPPSRGEEAQRRLLERFAGACTLVDGTMPGAAGEVVPDPCASAAGDAWPSPSLDAAHVAVILFTSGSTGDPIAQPKTWSALVRGAGTFAASFGPLPRDGAILGTVAPQHMFGLETTVMVPWQNGLPVAAARPLFPADLAAVAQSLADAGRRAWLMTTPLHLRAFLAALSTRPPLDAVVSSTMPLTVELAADIERSWHVPVHEIYGCTEGGMLATRRPARDARFTPAAGLAFALGDEGRAVVTGGHLDTPLDTGDRFARAGEDAALELVGRSGEIVKIAGKRATLAELSARLLSIPGVRDGVFVAPQPDATRLAALVVAPAHDTASLRRALAARIDPVFLPRPLLFAASLPRDAQGKLPGAALRDALQQATDNAVRDPRPDRRLERACVVAADHPSLPGHFPGQPLVPGVLLLERVEGLLREHGVAVTGVAEAKFTRAVLPDEPLRLHVELGADARARFTIECAGQAAASGTMRWRRRDDAPAPGNAP